MNTRRALAEALEEFAGVAIVVSQDHICIHVIASEGESIAKMYIGNGSDYETMLQEKFGKDPSASHLAGDWHLLYLDKTL